MDLQEAANLKPTSLDLCILSEDGAAPSWLYDSVPGKHLERVAAETGTSVEQLRARLKQYTPLGVHIE
jgi:hypothetical protein